MSASVIPPRVSDLLSVPARQEVEALITKRKSSRFHISVRSSLDEFLEAKLDGIKSDIEIFEAMKKHLSEALKEGRIPRSEYEEALQEVDEVCEPKEKEMILAEKQKNAIEQDRKEASQQSKLLDAYMSYLGDTVMDASAGREWGFNARQHFRDRCLKFHQAQDKENELVWCHLTGWPPNLYVKAAHIVPKGTGIAQLSLFFRRWSDWPDGWKK